jgi:hypothetical protein
LSKQTYELSEEEVSEICSKTEGESWSDVLQLQIHVSSQTSGRRAWGIDFITCQVPSRFGEIPSQTQIETKECKIITPEP